MDWKKIIGELQVGDKVMFLENNGARCTTSTGNIYKTFPDESQCWHGMVTFEPSYFNDGGTVVSEIIKDGIKYFLVEFRGHGSSHDGLMRLWFLEKNLERL